jgi:peptidoglycan/LPS O-acetylase OafA/YrhL
MDTAKRVDNSKDFEMVANVEGDGDKSDDYNTDEDDSDDYTDEYDSDDYTDDEDSYAPLVEHDATQDEPILPTSPFMPAGDSCRGIGVIIVILYHMGYEQFKNAWFVISLFFSLSGFIMTKNTVETFERRGHVDVFKFWAKRVSRLFPALLLTIVIVLLSQKLPIRKNDGVTFQREGEDTFYATIFLTNYNLAYNQVDDYFNEFATPSITRHMWTLSIEEQYYIIWPLVLMLITKLIMLMPKNDMGIDQYGESKRVRDIYVISGTSRRCISAILMLDIIVMTVSYYSSMTTIEKYDMSTAYYSTMCRMGDIAAGGFTYSSTRLIPFISRRWFRDPDLPPMSLKMRVILELMVTTLVVTLISIPMIQTPTEEMLIIYFEKLRLFVSLLLYGFVASTIQLSEPLPRWAIVSKILSFRPLIITGVISYGVYVFHWPILVYFGDPVGIGKKKVALGWQDPYEGVLGYHGRNAVLFLVVMVIGYASFMFFERPILFLSKVTMPKKTIATGFLSIGVTLLINWLITKDLPPMATFEVDQGEAYESIDTRFTPIFFSGDNMKSQRNLFLDKLDYRTRSIFPEGRESYDKIVADYTNPEFVDSDASVIIVCKNLKRLERSPCNDPQIWKQNTYWLWLESGYLCGTEPVSTQVDFQERCDDIISISELPVFEMGLGTKLSNSKLLEQVRFQLYEMILAMDDALPGVVNQDTILRLETEYERAMNGEEISVQNDSGELWDPIRITMMGDSVGVRIGMFWTDIVDMDIPALEDELIPSIALENGAQGGMPAIAYFACLSTHPKYQYEQCHHFKKSTPTFVLDTIKRTTPNVVVIHDGHHGRDDGQFGKEASKMGLETFFEKHMAFNILMNEAKKIWRRTYFLRYPFKSGDGTPGKLH